VGVNSRYAGPPPIPDRHKQWFCHPVVLRRHGGGVVFLPFSRPTNWAHNFGCPPYPRLCRPSLLIFPFSIFFDILRKLVQLCPSTTFILKYFFQGEGISGDFQIFRSYLNLAGRNWSLRSRFLCATGRCPFCLLISFGHGVLSDSTGL